MIKINEVIEIHEKIIEKYGGASGLRNKGLLESAISRAFATFGKQDLYKTVEKKATAILEGIIKNHPFVDGNKRIAYIVFRLYLLSQKLDINASQEEKYKFVMGIASGDFDFNYIYSWVKKNIYSVE